MVFLSGLFSAAKHLAKTAYSKFQEYDNQNGGGHLQKMLHKGLRKGAKKLAGWANDITGGEHSDLINMVQKKVKNWSKEQSSKIDDAVTAAGGTPFQMKKKAKQAAIEAASEPGAPVVYGNQAIATAAKLKAMKRRHHMMKR